MLKVRAAEAARWRGGIVPDPSTYDDTVAEACRAHGGCCGPSRGAPTRSLSPRHDRLAPWLRRSTAASFPSGSKCSSALPRWQQRSSACLGFSDALLLFEGHVGSGYTGVTVLKLRDRLSCHLDLRPGFSHPRQSGLAPARPVRRRSATRTRRVLVCYGRVCLSLGAGCTRLSACPHPALGMQVPVLIMRSPPIYRVAASMASAEARRDSRCHGVGQRQNSTLAHRDSCTWAPPVLEHVAIQSPPLAD